MARHGSTVVWVLLAAGFLMLPAMALAQDGNQTGQDQTNETDGTNGTDETDGTSGEQSGDRTGNETTGDQSSETGGNASASGDQATGGNATGVGGSAAGGMPSGQPTNNSSSFAQGGADGDPTAEAYTVWGALVAALGTLTAAAFRV